MPAPAKDQLLAGLLEPSQPLADLSFRDPYGPLRETGSNGLGSEVRAALPLLGFKISKT
jgi:hypothetical protein